MHGCVVNNVSPPTVERGFYVALLAPAAQDELAEGVD